MKRRISSQFCVTTTASSLSVARAGIPAADRRAARRDRARERRAACAAARWPKTSASSSEFDARRLAPCRPVQATSPRRRGGAMVVRPSRSVTTPPHSSARPARPGSARLRDVDAEAQAALVDGREARRGRSRRSRWRDVEETRLGAVRLHLVVDRAGDDVARRELGARVVARHERARRRAGAARAPSPRSASVMRNDFACGW